MRIRLAKLLIQLKNYTKCEKILRQVLTDSNEINGTRFIFYVTELVRTIVRHNYG